METKKRNALINRAILVLVSNHGVSEIHNYLKKYGLKCILHRSIKACLSTSNTALGRVYHQLDVDKDGQYYWHDVEQVAPQYMRISPKKRLNFFNVADNEYLSYYHQRGVIKRALEDIHQLLSIVKRQRKLYFYNILITGKDARPFNNDGQMRWTDKGNNKDVYGEYSPLLTKLDRQIRENKGLKHTISLVESIENPWHYKKLQTLYQRYMTSGDKALKAIYQHTLTSLKNNADINQIYSHPHVHKLIATTDVNDIFYLHKIIKKDCKKAFGYSPKVQLQSLMYYRDSQPVIMPAENSKHDPKRVVDAYTAYILHDYHLQTKDCGVSVPHELSRYYCKSNNQGYKILKALPQPLRRIIVRVQTNSTYKRKIQRYYHFNKPRHQQKKDTDTKAINQRIRSTKSNHSIALFNTKEYISKAIVMNNHKTKHHTSEKEAMRLFYGKGYYLTKHERRQPAARIISLFSQQRTPAPVLSTVYNHLKQSAPSQPKVLPRNGIKIIRGTKKELFNSS